MPFLSDFRYLLSGTEAPDVYLTWSGLSLLGAVAGRRFWTYHGRFQIYTPLYVVLVGDAGSGKSTCRSAVRGMFVKGFPQLKTSASIQSREDIVDIMASAECIQTWKDDLGEYGPKSKIYEFRPFYIISNELASLLSVDKEKMTEFLVDVFDEDQFGTGFKGQRLKNPELPQWFDFPSVSLLACATPRWFINNLRFDLFEGGLGRRLIIVNSEKNTLVDDPQNPLDHGPVLDNVMAHLKLIGTSHGEIRKTTEAQQFWKEWYHDPKRFSHEDPILMQFSQTKHIQVLKVATLLSLCDLPLSYEMDVQHLKGAIIMLDMLEKDISKLTRGVGRNVLAGISAAILDFVEKAGGRMTETYLKKFFWRELQIPECSQILQHLLETKQLFLYHVKGNNCFFTATGWQAYCQANSLELAPPSGDAQSPVSSDAAVPTSSPVASANDPGPAPAPLREPLRPASLAQEASETSSVPPSSPGCEPHEPSAPA